MKAANEQLAGPIAPAAGWGTPARMRRPGLIFVALTLGLGACTKTVPVQTDLPTPLVAPLPVEVAVYYDDSLKDFEHTEKVPQSGTWKVQLGSANQAMFERLFKSMFESVTVVTSPEAAFAEGDRFEAVIVPAIKEMQLAPPRYGESEFYEAWVQYEIDAYRPDRSTIVKWLVSGYGRSEGSLLGSSKSLEEATVLAMRDAAANILIKFKQRPRVKEWLEQQENAHERAMPN